MPQSRCVYRLTSLYLIAEGTGFDDADFDNNRPQSAVHHLSIPAVGAAALLKNLPDELFQHLGQGRS